LEKKMRRFFIPPERLHAAEPVLDEEDARHIRTVLRIGPGTSIVVFDGNGAEYEARIVAVDHRQVRVALMRPLPASAETPLHIALAQGYLKDKKMDTLVGHLTELGVTRWIPFIAHRSVATPDERRSEARHQRWRKISLESVKQCRRSRPMEIEAVLSFEKALQLSEGYALKLFFWESRGESLALGRADGPKPARVFIMIGPEGGFEASEQRAAERHGFLTMQMGPRILRAETAALAACTLIQYVFGDLAQNVLDNH
jgi:16S rRNA (uracil1498-N3)-methyltransferase